MFTLDGSDAALSTDSSDQDFAATEGVDPTWDAGAFVLAAGMRRRLS